MTKEYSALFEIGAPHCKLTKKEKNARKETFIRGAGGVSALFALYHFNFWTKSERETLKERLLELSYEPLIEESLHLIDDLSETQKSALRAKL
jgi:hypothetical protein